MRLIDADALLTEIEGRLEYVSQRQPRIAKHLHLFMSDGARIGELERLKIFVECNSTIDAVPVVRGRWIKSNKHIWRKTESGKVDKLWYEFVYHNGPGCELCGFCFCEHCNPEKWDDESCKDHYICSVCGRIEMKEEPYCNCGAKMDGGVE